MEAIINCSPGRVWGWELIWLGVHLQIGACADPSTKRGQAVFSSGMGGFASGVCVSLEVMFYSIPSTLRGRAEPHEAVAHPMDKADVPQTTDRFRNTSE